MSFYGNLDISEIRGMEREEQEEIYANVDPINSLDFRTETEISVTKKNQTPQCTENDSGRMRISRAASVCLVLLCFLLLTAVVALSVLIYTNSTNYTEERDELLDKTANLTEERNHLLIRHTNLTKEADQLKNKNTGLAKERDQLKTNNVDLAKERDQLQTRNTDLTNERDQLRTKNMQLNEERNTLSSNNNKLTEERDLLSQQKIELLKSVHEKDEWIYYQSSLYFISSEGKTWPESRRYCTERGADLIIINNRKEQELIKKMPYDDKFWIGLTDSNVEDRWKWVDGSALMTSEFWNPSEPNSYGGNDEDCALTYPRGWADFSCNQAHKWICEKIILK